MSRKAVFLDRDGTLIEDRGYIGCLSQVRLLPGVEEALLILKKMRFELIIISNQSGIGRGLISIAQVERINRYLTDILAFKGIALTAIYYCPHTPEDKCSCRKPSPEMVFSALKKYDISAKESYFIGDKWTDVETAINSGINPVLIGRASKQVEEDTNIVITDSLLTWANNLAQAD